MNDVTEDPSVSFAKINYGQEFVSVLNCSLLLKEEVSYPLSDINSLGRKLGKIPKKIGIFGYKSNPEYEKKEAELNSVIEGLKGTAEKVVKEFNEKNKKNIIVDRERVCRDYRCDISMAVRDDTKIEVDFWLPSFPVEISLEETLNLDPSMLLDSLSNLKEIKTTYFGIQPEKGNTSAEVLKISTKSLSQKKFGDVLDSLDRDVYAELKMRGKIPEPSFRSTIIFKPRKIQEIEIEYEDWIPPKKKEKEWLKRTVNILTGFDLS